MKRTFFAMLFAAGCFTAGLRAQTCAPIPTSYTLTVLPTFGGDTSNARAINSFGAVTGTADKSTGNHSVFLWTASGGMQNLGSLSGSDTFATAINDQGVIGGYGDDPPPSSATHPFLWSSSTGFQKLNNLSHSQYSFSYISGMDQQNRLVGNTSDDHHSFDVAGLWAGGKVHNLASLSGVSSFSIATGISDNGVVVGSAGGPVYYGAAWSLMGGFIQLPGLPGATLAGALGINKSGTIIVGDSSPGVGIEAVAWILDSSSGQYVINDISRGQAFAANDLCQVVGNISLDRAFIWTPTQGPVDLNTLIPQNSGVTLQFAYGINNAGQIVGQTAESGVHAYGFVLTPVP